MNDADFERLAALNGDRNGKSGQAMDIVRCSIERIDDPTEIGLPLRYDLKPLGLPLGSIFFAQEVVIWKRFMDDLADCFLGGDIRLRDQIIAPFPSSTEAVLPVEQNLAAAVRSVEADFQEVGHERA